MMANTLSAKTKRCGIVISCLYLELRPVNGASIQPRRRACLEPATSQPELLQRLAEKNRSRFSRSSRRILLLAAMNQPIKKCSGGDDDRGCAHRAAVPQSNTASNAPLRVGRVFNNQLRNLGLFDFQVRLRLQHFAHLEAVSLLVALGSR